MILCSRGFGVIFHRCVFVCVFPGSACCQEYSMTLRLLTVPLHQRQNATQLPFIYTRFAVAILLLAAAALKTLDQFEVLNAIDGARWFWSVAVIQVEFCWAIWLLTGLYQVQARRLTMFLFLAFGLVSYYRAISGLESCGCFGRTVTVNPWVMLIIDVVVLVSLRHSRPDPDRSWSRQRRKSLLAVSAGCLVCLALWGVTLQAQETESGIRSLDGLLIVKPEEMIGDRFGLSRFVEIPADLKRDRWFIIFHRHDCSTCRKQLPQMMRLAEQIPESSSAVRIALVEIPPVGHSEVHVPSHVIRGWMNREFKWLFPTPTALLVEHGVVKSSFDVTSLQQETLVQL